MKPIRLLRRCALRAIAPFLLLVSAVATLSTLVFAQQQTTLPPPPPRPQHQVLAPSLPEHPDKVITLEEAIDLAVRNNPTLQAQRTQVPQNKEQEVTANLRPNPTLSWDAQFIPIFEPHLFSSDYINQDAQFDIGVGYLFERGKKRQNRLLAAQGATAVTEAQTRDAERTLIANTAQQFITALLAKSTLEFSEALLQRYEDAVAASEKRGKIKDEQADLKLKLQTLQFHSDVTSSQIALVQALNSLRELIGFDALPRNYDIVGQLNYEPMTLSYDELHTRALELRPDLQAAQRGVLAARSQIALAKANSKQDLTVTMDYTHLAGDNLAAFFFQIPLPIFNRNQGEVARTYYALAQSQYMEKAAEEQVKTDLKNAYETLLNTRDVVQLYDNGYLGESEESVKLARNSYAGGTVGLLDFLDALRSYRSTQLSYRQALASYMAAMETLRQAIGTRNLK